MSEVVVTSFFTNAGVPATGITGGYPLVHIWLINPGVGLDTYVGQFVMTEVTDIALDKDGFYKYVYTTGAGWDPQSTYLFRTDGGPTIPYGERYQAIQLDPSGVVQNIAAEVWNATSSSYLIPGSTGEVLAQANANTAAIANNLFLNPNSVLDLVQLLLKFETNRTKIDPIAKTLTVYDDDCTTPLRTFKLLDTLGNPSIVEVCERKPTAVGTTDGQPVCP